MNFDILIINPGSTSTKIALYTDRRQRWAATLKYSFEELNRFAEPFDQFDMRLEGILNVLRENETPLESLAAVIGRGGLLKPVESGVYEVNDAMEHDLRHGPRQHAANMGASLARAIARRAGVKAYIADPPIADELCDEARITGLKDISRISIYHTLNHKAVARHYARSRGCRYEDMNLIVIHMGGGISVGAHDHGRVIDVNNALDGEGPIAPERAGTIPAGQLIDLCFSGRYNREELKKRCSGRGGAIDRLGTNSIIEVEQRIAAGDDEARITLEAMCYTIAKQAGAMAAVLKGRVDGLILTGGLANDANIVDKISERCSFIAPVAVYPGEDEMEALAMNAFMVLNGEAEAKTYA